MNPLLHIVLTLCASLAYQVHATLTSGNYIDHVIEEISKQLQLSDGKAVWDCDAILVSSPGVLDSQLCYNSNQHSSLMCYALTALS